MEDTCRRTKKKRRLLWRATALVLNVGQETRVGSVGHCLLLSCLKATGHKFPRQAVAHESSSMVFWEDSSTLLLPSPLSLRKAAVTSGQSWIASGYTPIVTGCVGRAGEQLHERPE